MTRLIADCDQTIAAMILKLRPYLTGQNLSWRGLKERG